MSGMLRWCVSIMGSSLKPQHFVVVVVVGMLRAIVCAFVFATKLTYDVSSIFGLHHQVLCVVCRGTGDVLVYNVT